MPAPVGVAVTCVPTWMAKNDAPPDTDVPDMMLMADKTMPTGTVKLK